MGVLLSGSTGLSEVELSKLVIGSLVELKYQERIGIIVKNLDLDIPGGPYRYLVHYDNGTKFGTVQSLPA